MVASLPKTTTLHSSHALSGNSLSLLHTKLSTSYIISPLNKHSPQKQDLC